MASPTLRLTPRLRPLVSPSSLTKPLVSRPRHFHSSDHPPPPLPFTASESSILSETTKHIPVHGFSHTTLALGAKDAGYIDASTNLFPRGAASVVHYWLWRQRTALKGKVEELDQAGLWDVEAEGKRRGVGAKVKLLTWERLMANKEVVHKWQEALSHLAAPSNVPLALTELSLLSDEIFHLASDTSVDFSWYTKRLSLSTIYSSTELFMTTDQSTDFKDTRLFMERRFDDGRTVGTALGSVGQWVGFTAGAAVNVLRSKGVRV